MSDDIDLKQSRRKSRGGNESGLSARKAFGKDLRQRRRHLAEVIRERISERPKMRDFRDRRNIAENLGGLLETASASHGVKIAHVLEAAGQGPSTKQYGRFALKPELSTEIKEKQATRLSPNIAVYRRIAEEAAKQSGQDVDALLIDLVRGSSYDPEASGIPAGEIPDWAFVLSEMITAIADYVSRNCEINWYFSKVEHQSLLVKEDGKGKKFEGDFWFNSMEEILSFLSRDGVFTIAPKGLGLFPSVLIAIFEHDPLAVEIKMNEEPDHSVADHHPKEDSSKSDKTDIFNGTLGISREISILLAPHGVTRTLIPLFATWPSGWLDTDREDVNLDKLDIRLPRIDRQHENRASPAAHSTSRNWVSFTIGESDGAIRAWYRVIDEGYPPRDLKSAAAYTFEEVTPSSCYRLLGLDYQDHSGDWWFNDFPTETLCWWAFWDVKPCTTSAPASTIAALVERNLYHADKQERLDHLLLESARDCCKRLKEWMDVASATMEERQNALRSEWTGEHSD